MKKHGFTLIELLVVISIIAVLMAIMMPALGKVKQQADRLVCNTHLKDMGSLINVYAADNNGKMVTNSRYTKRWYNLLGEIYGAKHATTGVTGSMYDIEIFKCPVEWRRHSKNLKGGVVAGDPESIAAASMYSYNGFFSCPINDNGTFFDTGDDSVSASNKHAWYSRLDRVQSSSELPLFWDSSSDYSLRAAGTASIPGFNGYPHMSLYKYGWDSGNIRSTKDTSAGPAVNHPGAINAVFADGHAESKGLWMYKDTLSAPNNSDYYWRYFHPTRAINPKNTTGDSFPGAGPFTR